MSLERFLLTPHRGLHKLKDFPFCYAKAAEGLLKTKGGVLLLSGFYIWEARAFENDGLLASLLLWQVLKKWGRAVYFAAEPECLSLWQRYTGCKEEELFELPPGKTPKGAAQWVRSRQIEVAIAIERPGRTETGRYFNMKGEDITEFVGQGEELFQEVPVTIGIGDGGNELGLGNLKRWGGPPSLAAFPSTYPLLAGTSNWGGYGLVRALEIKLQKELLWSQEEETKVQKWLLRQGIVDGVLKIPSMSVDGIPWGEYQKRWSQAKQLAPLGEENVKTSRIFPFPSIRDEK